MTRAPVDLPPHDGEAPLTWRSLPQMRFPNEYVWLIFFSSLDIMLTWVILLRGGHEVNPLANEIIQHWDLPGAIAFKFSLMVIVIVICEVVARTRKRLARNLAQLAVFISASPVIYSFFLLTVHTYFTVPAS